MQNVNEIFRTVAGSRLYGTATPQSDTDYKAVYLPTKSQILLGKRDQVKSKSSGGDQKNGANDVDVEQFELQEFLRLAGSMQTVAVEMLFAPVEDPHWLWSLITNNKDQILSKRAGPYVGYCKSQAVRYSLRGSRLQTFRDVVASLEAYADMDVTVSSVFSELTTIKDVKIVRQRQPDDKVIPYLDVHGRQVPGGIRVKEALKVYRKPVNEAGERAKAAADADGADWKALYHAVRIADQGIQLFSGGEIAFPSPIAPLLMEIRSGKHSYDAVLDIFDVKRALMEEAIENSELPDCPNQKWINELICETHEEIVRGKI